MCEARVRNMSKAAEERDLSGGEVRDSSTLDSSPGLLQLVHTCRAKHRSGPGQHLVSPVVPPLQPGKHRPVIFGLHRARGLWKDDMAFPLGEVVGCYI